MIKHIRFDEAKQVLRGIKTLDGGVEVETTLAMPERIIVTADHLRQFAREYAGKSYHNDNAIIGHVRAMAKDDDDEQIKKIHARCGKTEEEEIAAMDRPELEKYAMLCARLFDDYSAVLGMIPECPVHGSGCLPHYRDWLKKAMGGCEGQSTAEDGADLPNLVDCVAVPV